MNVDNDVLRLFEGPKKTPVKVYLNSRSNFVLFCKLLYKRGLRWFRGGHILYGEYDTVVKFLNENKRYIKDYEVEYTCRNSAMPLMNILDLNARVEPGAIIRSGAIIHDRVVVLMGAIINVEAEIGEETMIDMGAIIGARAIIGKKCHIGANTVIAGVLEPPSAIPCIIDDHVIIGANAVILEGVHIGENSVIGAGSIVLNDIPPNSVVVGNPGKIIKEKDSMTESKTQIVEVLRNI